MEKLEQNLGIKVYNLGAGRGFSVKEAVKAFENVSGIKLKVFLNVVQDLNLLTVRFYFMSESISIFGNTFKFPVLSF